MFDVEIFSKTAKGRSEISERSMKLAPRLRSALILVDGRTPFGLLKSTLEMLGEPEEIMDQLRTLELVESDYDLPPMPEFPVISLEEPTTMMEL